MECLFLSWLLKKETIQTYPVLYLLDPAPDPEFDIVPDTVPVQGLLTHLQELKTLFLELSAHLWIQTL